MHLLELLPSKGSPSIALTERQSWRALWLLALSCLPFLMNAQVVINEVQPNGTVELLNTGAQAVNVGDYWLCDRPTYRQIRSLDLECGDVMLEPGEILAVNNFNTLDNSAGEVGLFSTNNFGSANAIVDYVRWGSPNAGRAGVAIAAGIWTTDDFVPAIPAGQSIAFSGSGDNSSSWTAGSPTICAPNAGDGGGDECEIVTNDISLPDGSTSTSICVDGNPDPIAVTTNGGTTGDNIVTGWIITDAATGNILGTPAAGPFNLDPAGTGTCYIYYVRWEAGNFGGNTVGENIADLTGCFALSNFIEVIREEPDGGTVSLLDGSTTYEGTAGDIVLEVQHETNAPNLSYWYIITDANDNILAFANSANTNTLDLSGAPAGECHVWGWSYRGLDDPIVGDNISTLTDDDCEAISDNFITVTRNAPADECEIVTNDISLSDGSTSTSICVDGNPDPIAVSTNGGTTGDNIVTGWIITDAATGNILGTPAAGPFNLDPAGTGTCYIYYVRWEAGNFGGNTVGENIADLTGCFALSNFIEVIREEPDGGTVSLLDGSTTYEGTAGDIVFQVQHETDAPNLSYWYIITDANDNILAFANSANTNTLDLSGAPAGECHVWGWSYRGLDDPIVGDNISALTDDDCEAISDNFITVTRNAPADECEIVTNDISLSDGSTSICVDGNADPIAVTTNGGTTGDNIVTGWIITDAATGNILGAPAAGPFNLDPAGTGTCYIYYVRWEAGNFGGNTVGENIADLTGCFALSNFIEVIREEPDGGTVSLLDGSTTYEGTAGDIVFQVQHETNAPNLSYWYIITDANDNILAFANSANTNTLDLSGAPAGECHVWGWSYRGLDDPIVGDNISTLTDDDCEAISDNFITVTRNAPVDECEIVTNDISLPDGSTSTSICVDGNADPIMVVRNGGTTGDNIVTGWIITDAATGNILGTPAAGPFNLDPAGTGTCYIYYVRWEAGNFGGNTVGDNIADLTGCFALSNFIEVIREEPDGGTVSLLDGSTTYEGAAGDIVFQVQHETDAPNLSYWYIITDANDNILAFANSANTNTLDLSGAPAGECHVWGWSYRGLDDPIVGDNISTLTDDDCEAISDNFITVTRNAPAGNDGVLDLSMTVDNLLYNPFEEVVYRITVANDGTETLEDIVVNTPLPDGMVYTRSTQTQGDFNLFFERWNAGSLAAGESAYLDLTLFTLVRGEDLTLNVDSGDETASITITPLENGGFGSNEGDADLELTLTTELANYTIYEPITFRATLINNGSDAATNVVVAVGLPDGFAFTGSSVTGGRYNLFNEEWTVDNLAAGESVYLDLTIFPLITDVEVTQFVEVRSAFQQDPDSTPGNGNGQTANEDDEAVIVINSTGNLQPLGGINRLSFQEGSMTVNALYPNPTYDQVMLNLVSMKDVAAQISIVSQSGQVVQVIQREVAMGVNQLQFNVNDLAPGNYFIQVENVRGERQARQFTKVNQ